MNKDEELLERYQDFKEENDRINKSIINEVTTKAKKEGIEEGKKQGIAEGKKENQIEIVNNMYKMNLPIETISQATNLSIQEINETIKNQG